MSTGWIVQSDEQQAGMVCPGAVIHAACHDVCIASVVYLGAVARALSLTSTDRTALSGLVVLVAAATHKCLEP